jgi:hypothetical protein
VSQPVLEVGEHASGGADQGEVRTLDGEPPGPSPPLDVAQCPRCQAPAVVQVPRADLDQDLGHCGVRVGKHRGGPVADGEGFGRVLDAGGDLLEIGAVLRQRLGHRGLEQLALGREVVVEGPETHIGAVGDLLDADVVGAAFDEQGAGCLDQGPPRSRLAPVQSGRLGGFGGQHGAHRSTGLRKRLVGLVAAASGPMHAGRGHLSSSEAIDDEPIIFLILPSVIYH